MTARRELLWQIKHKKSHLKTIIYNLNRKRSALKRSYRIRSWFNITDSNENDETIVAAHMSETNVKLRAFDPVKQLKQEITTNWTKEPITLTINGKKAKSGFVSACPLAHDDAETCVLKYGGTEGSTRLILDTTAFSFRLLTKCRCPIHKTKRISTDDENLVISSPDRMFMSTIRCGNTHMTPQFAVATCKRYKECYKCIHGEMEKTE